MANYEQFANAASTTMNNGGTLSSGATSVIVTSAGLFPPSPNYRILIDSEIMLVTHVAGSTLTIARGVDGTMAASHTDGTVVTHVLTAASLVQAMADRSLVGAFSTMPAAGVAGREFNCTDAPFRYVDNGSSWQKYFGSYPLITPSDSGFSWDNQNSASLFTAYDMLTLQGNAGSTVSFRYKTAPSTPYTITAAFLANFNPRAVCAYYFGFRATSGKIIAMSAILNAGALNFKVGQWTTSTAYNGDVLSTVPLYPNGGLLWFRIADDGMSFTFSMSTDGLYFAQIFQAPRGAWLVTPAQVCYGLIGDATSSVSVISWG